MLNVLSKASQLKAEIRLAQAVSEFEADLSREEKAKYRTLKSQSLATTPSQHDVMCLTAEIDRRISSKFSGRCYGPRFTNFLQGVQQFAALGDVVVGGSQNLIACGVWSLVRMSLLSIITVSNYVEKLSSIFMDIGRSAPRHQALTLLYPQSKKLPSYLSEYFIAVVSFCRLLFNFGRKSAVQQFTSSLSESCLKSFQAELDKWALCIKDETNLENMKEGTDFRATSNKLFKWTSDQQTLQQRRRTRLRVLDYCSTYDHEVTWKQIRKAGTTSTYTQCTEYTEWKTSPCSKTLMFMGKLGSGKSVSLANIVDDLNLYTTQERHPVALFFCKHDVLESLSARTIIGSLARQLLRNLPDLSMVNESCEDAHITGDVDEVIDLLIRAFPSSCKAYFVLDGFDECNTDEQDILVDAIAEIQMAQNLLVCVSQRQKPGQGVQPAVGKFVQCQVISSVDNSADIDMFIEAELERCLTQNRLNIGDPNLILEIQTALSEGSQGMFLWASLQIQSLCLMKTDYTIRAALADLPKDLSETFSRILQKCGNSDLPLQSRILQLVLAACRHLTTEELREALSVTPGDAIWDSTRILNDVYSALACCGCLLIVDEEELTVRVVHHSVTQYILDGIDGAKHVGFTLEEAQRTLGDIVVTYLSYGIFGTELSSIKAIPMFTQSVPSQVLQATLGPSSNTRKIAIKLLKSKQQPVFDMSKTFIEQRGSFMSKPESTFGFYVYAKTYWQYYVWFVSENNASIFKLASKLIHGHASELRQLKSDGWARLHGAAKIGNENMIALLLQSGIIDVEAKDNSGHTLLIHAVVNGHVKVADLLLRTCRADVEATSDGGLTPLTYAVFCEAKDMVMIMLSVGKANVEKMHKETNALLIAAKKGYEGIVEVLLTVGKADVEVMNGDAETPLILAVKGGHANTVEVLLRIGKAKTEMVNTGRRPLLHLAAKEGHTETAKVLLSVGRMYVDEIDSEGRTALMWAAKYGKDEVARMLLSNGKANVNQTDKENQTALLWAASYGKTGVLRVLLSVDVFDLNARDKMGRTALTWAAINGQKQIVKMLLDSVRVGKVDVNARDEDANTPLMWAAMKGRKRIVETLLDSGRVDVNARDSKGRTALMWAAAVDDSVQGEEVTEMLLRLGRVDVKARDHDGKTALAWSKNPETTRMLKSYTSRT